MNDVDRTGTRGRGSVTEAEAARIALSGTTRERVTVGVRALRDLLRDPDDTAQVFLLGLAVNAPFFPRLFARFASTAEGARLLAERPTIDSRSVDFARLRSLPETTLGGAYARYLGDNGLDPDLFQPPPGLPEVPRFVAQRIRQTHDIWHVLTGYAPDVPGELALQGFTFAQLHMPSSLVIAAFGTLAKAPREAARVLEGYRRGQEAAFLPVVRFEDHWDDDLDVLRARLGVRPARARLVGRSRDRAQGASASS